MTFSIQPLLIEDVPTCVQVYFDSFQNSHSLVCWPRVPAIRAFWEAMFIDEMSDPKSHFLKAVDSQSGELAAFCKWVEPKPGVFPDLSLPEWPKEADVALCNETFGMWAVQHRELMQDRGHWYLEIVGTATKFQRQGAGSKLIAYGCERADEQGCEAFLEASPEALRLYHKLGFHTAAEMHTLIEHELFPPGNMYTETFMIRKPRTN